VGEGFEDSIYTICRLNLNRSLTSGLSKLRSPSQQGDLNRLIDDVCHPRFKERPDIILIDTFLQGLVEQNPPLTIKKFLRHNLTRLIEEIWTLRTCVLEFSSTHWIRGQQKGKISQDALMTF